jgi:hypothetical protein
MNPILQTLFVSIIAGILTYAVSIKLKKGGVFGSALIVLISGLLYKFYLLDNMPGTIATFAAVATTASYAGMVAEKNVKNIWEMAIVGLIAGALFLSWWAPGAKAPIGLFAGVGGALGTIAAIACFAFISIKNLTVKCTCSNKKPGK